MNLLERLAKEKIRRAEYYLKECRDSCEKSGVDTDSIGPQSSITPSSVPQTLSLINQKRIPNPYNKTKPGGGKTHFDIKGNDSKNFMRQPLQDQSVKNTVRSWDEERSTWLEKKRDIYNSKRQCHGKENTDPLPVPLKHSKGHIYDVPHDEKPKNKGSTFPRSKKPPPTHLPHNFV